MSKIDIKSLNKKELTEFVESLGEKAFRAKQIYQWIHEKQVDSFAEMTNISKKFIDTLEANAYPPAKRDTFSFHPISKSELLLSLS